MSTTALTDTEVLALSTDRSSLAARAWGEGWTRQATCMEAASRHYEPPHRRRGRLLDMQNVADMFMCLRLGRRACTHGAHPGPAVRRRPIAAPCTGTLPARSAARLQPSVVP